MAPRRIRRRTLLRWIPPGLAVATLVAAMVTVVGRSERGRALSVQLDALDAEAGVVADRIAKERVRVDSLTSLPRIEEAAASVGLRRAEEEELVQVEARVEPDPEGIAGPEVGGER